MFSDTVKGAVASANLYSIVEPAKANGVEPHAYQAIEAEINFWHQRNEWSQKLAAIPGIGPITASALVASIGNAKAFANGRQLAAWLGLVPRQHSSGGKQPSVCVGALTCARC